LKVKNQKSKVKKNHLSLLTIASRISRDELTIRLATKGHRGIHQGSDLNGQCSICWRRRGTGGFTKGSV